MTDPGAVNFNVQMITHKGEIIFVFSQPIGTWSMAPKAAREIAANMLKAADALDEPKGKAN